MSARLGSRRVSLIQLACAAVFLSKLRDPRSRARTFHPQPVPVQHPVHRTQCAHNAARALQEPETFRGLTLPCSEFCGHIFDYKRYAEHGCAGCGPVGSCGVSAYLLKQGEAQARGPDGGLRVDALSGVVHRARTFLLDRLQPCVRLVHSALAADGTRVRRLYRGVSLHELRAHAARPLRHVPESS